ncbi:hypothetical protein PsorP6_005939 [Peronosclerospora sorghi]|uniref:Uncharacterized protein n=1 Tax=Peronosclerospora sorghi TaxID=230839 RepID=A0ACC0W1I9_9STRA|nr:hypothetical protein PsorP6_005939 [Peronosclerospora sorghi]
MEVKFLLGRTWMSMFYHVLRLVLFDMDAFEFAKDKIIMEAETQVCFDYPESAKATAYHEVGHALVAINTPGAHPVYKATIIPRAQALGMVSQLPEGDQRRFR